MKFKSKHKNFGFYVDGERRKFSNYTYETTNHKEIYRLKKLSSVETVKAEETREPSAE